MQTKREEEILENKTDLDRLQDELHLNKISINNTNKRLAELVNEMQLVDKDISILTKTKDTLINNRDENATIASFLYSNTIQQNSVLKNQINNQILDYNLRKERAKNKAKEMKKPIEILSKKKDDLERKKTTSRMFKFYSRPQAVHIQLMQGLNKT